MLDTPKPIQTDMNRFSIKDIENLTGIKAHTIRIWEQRYGILKPKRTPTNIRYYDANDLKSALRISLLNSFGYKISRIHQMTDGDMDGLIHKISDADFKLQILTNELLEAALAMDMERFERILNTHINKVGIEVAMEGLAFQFLEKIGVMWIANYLVPAQEHLASNILYRKLAVAVDGLPQPQSGPKVLLFLPEGEVHEMALMYVQYLLRKAGKIVIYLGTNTPLKDAAAACVTTRPDYVYVHLTAVAKDWEPTRYLKKLTEAIKDIPILISGGMLQRRQPDAVKGVRLLNSLAEVRDLIATL